MSQVLTLAVTWSPFIRGIVVVLIAFGVLCGSVYLLLATNLGARLGFLVALASLFGWLALLGTVWWVYGIGLKGKDPTWKPVAVINEPAALVTNPTIGGDGFQQATETERVNGWRLLAEDDPERSQAIAASDDILQNQAKVFAAGDYLSVAVFDKGGARFPLFGSFDFLAFFHRPRYALVQVQPVIKQNTEPGQAPPTPKIDPNAAPHYVLMIRDQGNRRRPAAAIAIGSIIMFLLLCLVLHRREELVEKNRNTPAPPPGDSIEPVGAGV